MRIAVTGGAGFIGARVAARLRRAGHDVVTIGHHGSEDLVTDLLDEDAARAALCDARASILVHCAWSVKGSAYESDPGNDRWVGASASAVRAFLDAGGDGIVIAGTCFEYGAGRTQPLRETDTPEPASAYGNAKLALYASLSKEIRSSARFAWARIFYPYGLGEPPRKLISYLLDEISNDRVPVLHQPDRSVDLIHADDVAEALCRMAADDVSGIVNVGSGIGATARDVARRVALRLRPSFVERIDAIPSAALTQAPVVADTTLMHERLGRWPLVALDDGIDSMLGR